MLMQSDFNLTEANTDSAEITLAVERNIFKMATPHITHSVFQELCTDYSDQPHVAIEHIKQSYVDTGGATVTTKVFTFISVCKMLCVHLQGTRFFLSVFATN